MSYQVLARKWRPRSFEQMVGQQHVVRALVNALDGERVDLSRSPLQARVLAGLARAQAPLTTAELVAIGWPGERIRPDSAANRLYVVLNALRKLGLREWITRSGGGYVLRSAESEAP